MTFEDGALVEPLAVAYLTSAQAKATFRDQIVIIGGGTIGLLYLAVAKVVGVKQAIITVKYSAQAQLAREFGADHIVDVSKGEMVKALLELTKGKDVDAVIETVFLADSAVMGEHMPDTQQFFHNLFVEGGDTPMEEAVKMILQIAAGEADELSGCYISVDDDITSLSERFKAQPRTDELTLRITP